MNKAIEILGREIAQRELGLRTSPNHLNAEEAIQEIESMKEAMRLITRFPYLVDRYSANWAIADKNATEFKSNGSINQNATRTRLVTTANMLGEFVQELKNLTK